MRVSNEKTDVHQSMCAENRFFRQVKTFINSTASKKTVSKTDFLPDRKTFISPSVSPNETSVIQIMNHGGKCNGFDVDSLKLLT